MEQEDIVTDGLTGLPVLRAWNFKYSLSRVDMPEFCQALHDVVKAAIGGQFYWPRSDNETGKCRFDWFIKVGRERYGARIALVFDVGVDDLSQISGFLLPGRRSQIADDLDLSRLENRCLEEIDRVIDEAESVMKQAGGQEYCPLVYICFPVSWLITREVESRNFVAYASAFDRINMRYISGIAIRLRAYSGKAATSRVIPWADKIAAVLSVLSGQGVKAELPLWPRGRKRPVVNDNWPTTDRVYPKLKRYQPVGTDNKHQASGYYNDASSFVRTSFEVLSNLHVPLDAPIWRAMYAYKSGQELHKDQPTLASVAYLAALGAFSRHQDCKGEVVCSICGDRPKHPLKGDLEMTAEFVVGALKLGVQSSIDCRELIRSVYQRQRSPFVHDAVLRHAEIGDLHATMGGPSKTSSVSPVLKFQEDLSNMQRLTRRVILSQLAPFSEDINRILSEIEKIPLLLTIPLVSSITVGTRAVNLVMVPD